MIMTSKLAISGIATALVLAANVSRADISFTPTVATDYDFRGISLTARGPTIQGELDLAASNGLKGYIFASNTDLGISGLNTEIDYAVGWAGGQILQWDVGVVYYTYPSYNTYAYPEAWVGVSKAITPSFTLAAKAWYSHDYAATGDAGQYYELNGTFALPWGGVGLGLHVAHSAGAYWDNATGGGYTDYAIGLTKSVEKLNFSLKMIDGSDLKDGGVAVNSTDRKIVFGISTTFPWK
jgi:uncharacterized protein (TIGR02001 family)